MIQQHCAAVFKLVQDLLEPATGSNKGKSQFQALMNKLPSEHKARWFAGAALDTSEQAMASTQIFNGQAARQGGSLSVC